MRHIERTVACLGHLAGLVPIWGLLIMALMLWRFRERSRAVTFHVQQAIFFHVAMLFVLTGPLLVYGVGRLVGVLRPETGVLLETAGVWLLTIAFMTNAVIVLWAANETIDGRPFNYPIFGRWLRGTSGGD